MRKWILGLFLALSALASFAQSRVIVVQAYEQGGTGGTVRGHYESYNDPLATGKTAWSHRISPGIDLWSEGSADLSSGTLRVGLGLPEYYYGGFARGWVTFEDTFSVGNIAPDQIGRLNYLFNGQFMPGAPINVTSPDVLARLNVRIVFTDLRGAHVFWERNALLDPVTCVKFFYPGQTCIRDTSVHLVDGLDIPLLQGTYSLSMSLLVDSYQGWDANFQHTARAYLDLPAGVTLNSSSGVLFTTATPVPEVQSLMLMLGGLMLISSVLRLRTQSIRKAPRQPSFWSGR